MSAAAGTGRWRRRSYPERLSTARSSAGRLILPVSAIVGAFGDVEAGHISGATYIFERGGTSWTQAARVLGDTLEAGFANSVAISGDYAVRPR